MATKGTLKQILQFFITVLTALVTTIGATSCV